MKLFVLGTVLLLPLCNAAVVNKSATAKTAQLDESGCTLLVRTEAAVAMRVYARGKLAQSVPILSGIRSLDTLAQNRAIGGGAVIEPYYLERHTRGFKPETLAEMRSSAPFVRVKFNQACSDTLLETVGQTLKGDPEIIAIGKSGVGQAAGEVSDSGASLPAERKAPNDPDFPKQWGFRCSSQPPVEEEGDDRTHIPCSEKADMKTRIGKRREPKYDVGVVSGDSGLYRQHPDFDSDRIWDDRYGMSFVEGRDPKDTRDQNGHGTDTAGHYLMTEGNGKFGVGFGNSRVHHITHVVFGENLHASAYTLNLHIWATIDLDRKFKKAGLDIIVLSTNSWVMIEGGIDIPAMRAAVLAHVRAGIPFIVAAGNGNENNDIARVVPSKWANDPDFQAAPAPLIAVGAIRPDGKRADFSNWGYFTVDVAAPGDDDYSVVPPATGKFAAVNGSDAGWRKWRGTSMSTPKVAGVIAELLSIEGRAALATLRYRVAASASKLPELEELYWGGTLNFYEMVTVEDARPPEPVRDARLVASTRTSAVVELTVPQDFATDGSYRGGAALYDARVSPEPIRTHSDFMRARRLYAPWPKSAGQRERLEFSNLPLTAQRYLSLRLIDKGGNFTQVDFGPLAIPGVDTEKFLLVPNGGFEELGLFLGRWPQPKHWQTFVWCDGCKREFTRSDTDWEASRYPFANDVAEGSAALRLWNGVEGLRTSSVFVLASGDPMPIAPARYDLVFRGRIYGVADVAVFGYRKDGSEVWLTNQLLQEGSWEWITYRVPFAVGPDIVAARVRFGVRNLPDGNALDADHVRIAIHTKP